MAQSIGAKIRSAFVAVLVGLLVLAFAVWGVNDMFVPGVRNAVISVGDESVSTREFDRDLRNVLRETAVQTGEGLTNEQAYQQGIHQRILNGYLTRVSIAKDADDLGVGVNRADAKKYIESIPAFQSEVSGQFDRSKLEQLLAQNNIESVAQFEKDTLRDLRRQQSVEAIIAGITAPTGYAKRYFDFVSEQRKTTILTLNKDAVPAPETPDDETLQAYLDQNAVRYTAPEYRKVTMIRLEPAGYMMDIDVSEDDVQSEYDRRVASGTLGAPETRDVVILTASDEGKATEAAERLSGGEEPASVATALGLVAPDRFNGVQKNGLLDSIADETAFALSEGEAKATLNDFGGWQAIYVPTVTPANNPSFASLEPELRQEIGLNHAKDKIFELVDEIDLSLTEGRSIESIAEALSLPIESYDFIDRAGTTRDGLRMTGSARIPGIATDDELLRRIFTAGVGYETDVFETTQEGAATLRVLDVIDSDVRPLDTIREEVLAAWTADQINTALIERARQLTAEINDAPEDAPITLEDLAEQLGDAAVLREVGISRATPPRDIGPQVVVDLLSAETGAIVRGPGPLPQTYDIARLDAIVPNADGLAGEILDVLQERQSAEISGDIQNAYQSAILRAHNLREYPDQVRGVMGIETPK